MSEILVVEDSPTQREQLLFLLQRAGYETIAAPDGAAALELARARRPALVLTDVVMPRMDGPALVREVRELHPDMKVIFISGYTEDAFRQRLDSDSEIHFLPKPFSLRQLASKVKEVISGEMV